MNKSTKKFINSLDLLPCAIGWTHSGYSCYKLHQQKVKLSTSTIRW